MGRTSDTKERLIKVATRLIWEKSYSTVSVDKICKEAGVNKGSFYHFFPSKENLTLEALDFLWHMGKEQVFEPSFSSDLPPLERFNRFFLNSYNVHSEMEKGCGGELGCPFGNLGSEVGVDEDILRNKVREIFQEICAYFEGALRDGVNEGVFDCPDVSSTAQSLAAFQSGLLLMAKVHDDIEMLRLFIPGAAKLIGVKEKDGLLVPPLEAEVV